MKIARHLFDIVPSRRSLFLVAIASAALASLTPLDPARRLAPGILIPRIAQTETFEFGGIGLALTISRTEIAYRELLSYPGAAADFERVFAEGNPQGKAYALVGLRQTSLKRFVKLSASVQTSTMPVQIGQGCVVFVIPMGDLVGLIRAGLFSGPMTRNPPRFP